MRSMMGPETIKHNCDCFLKPLGKFIEFGEDKVIVVNNADWLLDLKYIDLLRDVGACFSVNNMLCAECYKQRMERGLSFFEFNYMIMQSYDFLYLNEHYGCNMQFGGDDQWSNMLAGTDLIRRKTGKNAYAMTIALLMNSEGNKMGKTAKGAVWLDPEKTTPFEFYQYWRNIDDADVMKCIRMLTFIPIEEIEKMDKWDEGRINGKKEVLAYSLTALVHGEKEADKARETSKALFSGNGNDANMPTTIVPSEALNDEKISVVELLLLGKIGKSKSEVRRLISQGGITIDGNRLEGENPYISKEQLMQGIKVKKGKKHIINLYYDFVDRHGILTENHTKREQILT